MIQDLHSHTYYSFCGKDSPEVIIEAAIEKKIDMLGICDHNYGIAHGRKNVYRSTSDELFDDYERTLRRYFDHISLLKEKYAKKIKILRGIEVATLTSQNQRLYLPAAVDISFFDYCMLEHIDCIGKTSTEGDIFSYADRCGCPVGIAHTDIFAYIESIGESAFEFLCRMAEHGIFWELNVNYDSIHGYREHEYVKRFFESVEQQKMISNSGVKLSVGFDGHRIEDYQPCRVFEACEKIEAMGIPLVFSD